MKTFKTAKSKIVIGFVILVSIILIFLLMPTAQSYRKKADFYKSNNDYKNTLKYYEKAFKKNDIESAYLIAKIYINGEGGNYDMQKAIEWYTLAAEKGSEKAQYELGTLFDNIYKNIDKAIKWYSLSGEKGNLNAQCRLGEIFEQEKHDFVEAVKWYKLAANQGHADIQYKLGKLLEEGKGISKNMEKALMWYQAAGEKGNNNAQYRLGLLFEKDSIRKNIDSAIRWYTLAGNKGNNNAQYRLGTIFENIKKDSLEANQWYKKAAEKENGIQYIIGRLYEGNENNIVEAIKWYKWAVESPRLTDFAVHNNFIGYFFDSRNCIYYVNKEREAPDYKHYLMKFDLNKRESIKILESGEMKCSNGRADMEVFDTVFMNIENNKIIIKGNPNNNGVAIEYAISYDTYSGRLKYLAGGSDIKVANNQFCIRHNILCKMGECMADNLYATYYEYYDYEGRLIEKDEYADLNGRKILVSELDIERKKKELISYLKTRISNPREIKRAMDTRNGAWVRQNIHGNDFLIKGYIDNINRRESFFEVFYDVWLTTDSGMSVCIKFPANSDTVLADLNKNTIGWFIMRPTSTEFGNLYGECQKYAFDVTFETVGNAIIEEQFDDDIIFHSSNEMKAALAKQINCIK